MRKVTKTPVRLSNNFNHAWSFKFELFEKPRSGISVGRQRLTGNDKVENMDFCVYDVIMPVLKSGMIIKMQNKLHDRLFSGLMRQLTKEESEQKGRKATYGNSDVPNTGVLSMLDQLMNNSISPTVN